MKLIFKYRIKKRNYSYILYVVCACRSFVCMNRCCDFLNDLYAFEITDEISN